MSIDSLIYPKTGHSSKELLQAWEDIILHKRETKVPVKEEVLLSWRKCIAVGVDPFTPPEPLILKGPEFSKLCNENRELIEFAKPVMEMLEMSVRGSGFITTLADKSGYVLEALGDEHVMKMAQNNGYLPGCLRSANHAGTNAISLCLEEGAPIQLIGQEHYKISHHDWTCSSAPIHGNDGSIVGTITLSGSSAETPKLALALVCAAAEDVQGKFRERGLVEQTQRLNYLLSSIYNSVSDGFLALDKQLNITHLNAAAEKLLGIDKEVVLKKQFNDLVKLDKKILTNMERGKGLESVELTFSLPNGFKLFICQVAPILSNSFKCLGSIVTITEPKKMMSIAKQIGGNYAKYEFSDIIGNNNTFQSQIEMAKTASKTNSRVLIMGESGTGKELFAQSIHCHSYRNEGPFVAISCAAIPRDLVESELFGYKGGAFTGARSKGMIGKFELANGGTLFLDEINGLPLQLQSKLLRVLQMNEIMRLGDNRNIPIDVRVIAASNTDLVDEVEQGNFREDLYYRLNVMEIFVPPLRERMDDLEPLINHILTRLSKKLGVPKPLVKKEALSYLKGYDFPGNVRELENLIERALLLCKGKNIEKSHLFVRPRRTILSSTTTTYKKTIKAQYKDMIIETIKKCDGNYSKTARELNIGRSTLYRKMSEFGINK